jgi:hypothetical protein
MGFRASESDTPHPEIFSDKKSLTVVLVGCCGCVAQLDRAASLETVAQEAGSNPVLGRSASHKNARSLR